MSYRYSFSHRYLARATLVAAAVIVATSVRSFAQDVLLPLPKPLMAGEAVNPAASAGAAPLSLSPAAVETAPDVVDPSPSASAPYRIDRKKISNRGVKGKEIVLTPEQKILVAKANAALSRVQHVQGTFVQIAPDGARSEGKFSLLKPGRIRFTYTSPPTLDIVSNGTSVTVMDKKMKTNDIYPLSSTPLKHLLSSQIQLERDTRLIAVDSEPDWHTFILEERGTAAQGRIALYFSGSEFTLRQWTITDAQGLETAVAIYNLDMTKRPDEKLFTVKVEQTRDDINR